MKQVFFASIYFTRMARWLIEANAKASPWDNGSKEPCPRIRRSGHGRPGIRTEDRGEQLHLFTIGPGELPSLKSRSTTDK